MTGIAEAFEIGRAGSMQLDDTIAHDEFAALEVYAGEHDIAWNGRPSVHRSTVTMRSGYQLSFINWGDGPPELAFVHGRGQNAHTWDSVAIALDRPLVAVDLPGHGHSEWFEDHDYGPTTSAEALEELLERSGSAIQGVVGMSLGGLVALHVAARRPDLVPRLVMVDVTPGSVERGRSASETGRTGLISLLSGPTSFATFEEMLAVASAAAPHRPLESLRIGVRHNALRREDGTWTWRYDPHQKKPSSGLAAVLWKDLAGVRMPLLLVRGGDSPIVSDGDVIDVLRRCPTARVELIEGAGHSVQSDRPIELASLIGQFLETS